MGAQYRFSSCSMSRSSLMPAIVEPIAVLMPSSRSD